MVVSVTVGLLLRGGGSNFHFAGKNLLAQWGYDYTTQPTESTGDDYNSYDTYDTAGYDTDDTYDYNTGDNTNDNYTTEQEDYSNGTGDEWPDEPLNLCDIDPNSSGCRPVCPDECPYTCDTYGQCPHGNCPDACPNNCNFDGTCPVTCPDACPFSCNEFGACPALEGACCNGGGNNGCAITTEDNCREWGHTWDGSLSCPGGCGSDDVGACCDGLGTNGCQLVDQQRCIEFGHTWHGAASCLPSPCGNIEEGACCDGHGGNGCQLTTQERCERFGHTFNGVPRCLDPNPCGGEDTGACCSAGLSCSLTTREACFDVFISGETCIPSPCGQSDPDDPTPGNGFCCDEPSTDCSFQLNNRACRFSGPFVYLFECNDACAMGENTPFPVPPTDDCSGEQPNDNTRKCDDPDPSSPQPPPWPDPNEQVSCCVMPGQFSCETRDRRDCPNPYEDANYCPTRCWAMVNWTPSSTTMPDTPLATSATRNEPEEISNYTSSLSLDVDGNGVANTTDGIILNNYLEGKRGSALFEDVNQNGEYQSMVRRFFAFLLAGTSRSPQEIEAFIRLHYASFDIDGDGTIQAKTDGTLAVRALSGVHGTGLVAPLCDDGNFRSGDGCSSARTPEAGWTCGGTPSVCVRNTGLHSSSSSLQPSCSDSDGGLNYPVKGDVRWVHGSSTTTIGDRCSNSQTLAEAYCTSSGPAIMTVLCPGGCVGQGACQAVSAPSISSALSSSSQLSCTDSDGGLNYTTWGRAGVGTQTVGDKCMDGRMLAESYCTSFGPGVMMYMCPGGCAGNGVCLTASSSSLASTSFSSFSSINPCGNGSPDSGEQCDDGNTRSGDGCSSCRNDTGWVCTGFPGACQTLCGDSIRVGTEQCDDGNITDNDGCSRICTLETATSSAAFSSSAFSTLTLSSSSAPPSPSCGNTRLDEGEQCERGAAACPIGWACDYYSCQCNPLSISSVAPPFSAPADPFIEEAFVCGNGTPDPGEQCDDGNTLDGDGCSAFCSVEYGAPSPSSLYPSAPISSAPVPPSSSSFFRCGNGVFEPGEQCELGYPCSGGMFCSGSCMCTAIVTSTPTSSVPMPVSPVPRTVRSSAPIPSISSRAMLPLLVSSAAGTQTSLVSSASIVSSVASLPPTPSQASSSSLFSVAPPAQPAEPAPSPSFLERVWESILQWFE